MEPNTALGGVPELKYLDLAFMKWAGRGGAVRFLLLAVQAEFTDTKISYQTEWPTVKQALIDSGDSLTGTVPVVYIKDKVLADSYAILRRFAKQLGLYGKDVERDYATDLIAESVQEFRSQLVAAAVGDDNAKATYKTTQRGATFKLLEALVSKFGGGANGHVVAGEGITYADCLVFALLWDDSVLFTTDMILASPNLKAFYNTFLSNNERVALWCASIKGGDPLPSFAELQVA